MKSYAQNFEDAILWQALRDVQGGFYIDVGAAWPEEISVTKAFYDIGWHGINIEPDFERYKLLVAQRPRDINLHVAAGATTGSATFYCYDRGVGIVADTPAVHEMMESHGHKGHPATLGVATLDQILAEHPPPPSIHFLKIDVDGYEEEVFKGLSLKRYRPWIIVVEAITAWSDVRVDYRWNPQLLDHHYSFVYFDGANCYYVAQEYARKLKTRWALCEC